MGALNRTDVVSGAAKGNEDMKKFRRNLEEKMGVLPSPI